MTWEMKCKKCRRLLFKEIGDKHLFLNAHGVPTINKCDEDCLSINEGFTIYFSEDSLPDWITLRIEAEEWSKGRLNCPECDCRIGGFDFISGQKCNCSGYILPPVHMIISKVDLIKSCNQ